MTHHPTPGDREFADHLQQLADRVRAGDYEGIEYTSGPEIIAGNTERVVAHLRITYPPSPGEREALAERGPNAAPTRVHLP